MSYARSGEAILTAAGDGTVRRWDAVSGRQLAQTQVSVAKDDVSEPDEKEAIAFSPDGNGVARRNRIWSKMTRWKFTDSVDVWDVMGKRAWRKEFPESFMVGAMAYAPDAKTVVIGGSNRPRAAGDGPKVKLIEAASGKQLWEKELRPATACNAQNSCSAAVFAPHGKTLAVVVQEHHLCILDAATGRELLWIASPNDSSWWQSLTYTPDGKVLAAIIHSSQRPYHDEIGLWSAATGQMIRRFHIAPHESTEKRVDPLECYGASSLAFAPDGWTMACGTHKSIRLWDLASNGEFRRLQGFPDNVLALAYGPDGRSLVSTSSNGTALVWDLVGQITPGRTMDKDLRAEQLAELWNDLAGADAARADRALWSLAGVPAQAVSFLRSKLRPVVPQDPARLRRLISGLDAAAFTDRKRATQEIKKLESLTVPALRHALDDKPSLEARRRIEALLGELDNPLPRLSGESLRENRAVRALERAGTAEAKQCLKELAAGAPGALLTREAEAALRRLSLADFLKSR